MSNFPFTAVAQYDDIGVRNLWKDLVETGKVSAAEYLANNAATSRDNSRTPMQWSSASEAGFTSNSKPWLAVNPNYAKINVDAESKDANSVLSFYRRLIEIRKAKPLLTFGSYRDISGENHQVYGYVRADKSGQAIVILNFSDEPADFQLPGGLAWKQVTITNIAKAEIAHSAAIRLQPWQSVILE